MSDERNDAGQFTSGEVLTGEAGLEHDAGYKPMPAAETEDQPEYATAREAADALAEQEQPATDVVVYLDQTGERVDERETIKLERAGADLAAYESQVADHRASSIDSTFAEAVDKLRAEATRDNPALAEELGLDKEAVAAKPVEEKQAAPQSDQPGPYDNIEGLAPETREALKTNPQLRQFLETNAAEKEQAVQHLKDAVSHNQTFGQAAILALAPELGQVPLERWAEGINMIAQADPARGQQLATMFNNVAALNQRQQLLAHYDQQQRAQIENQQFESQIKAEDARLIDMAGGEKAANEATAAMLAYLGESGVPHSEMLNTFRQNPVLQTAEARLVIAKAAKYDAMMKSAKAIPSRPVPPVQRPGVYAPRASGPTAEINALLGQMDGKSQAQQLKLARRIIELKAG